MATIYSTGNKDYYRPFLSGFLTHANEIQIGYQINSHWSIVTGANYQVIVTALYWGQTFNDHYIIEKYYPTKGGWYEAGSNTSFNPDKNFYNIYSGFKINYRIAKQFNLNIEPFISYQLKNNDIIENVYNRLFFGIKTGLSFYFKK